MERIENIVGNFWISKRGSLIQKEERRGKKKCRAVGKERTVDLIYSDI